MKTARMTLSVASVVLLGLGYLFSVRASLTGDSEAYARQVDQPPIRYGALLLLVAAIVFGFVRERSAE